ncbi:oligosaccharide flippase family protein [Roseivirga echinicomitans]
MNRSILSVILIIGRGLALTLNLLTVVILARLLSVAEYGLYQQVWLFYLLFSPIFQAGLPASIIYFLPNFSSTDRKSIVFQTMLLLMAFGALLSLASVMLSDFVLADYSEEAVGDYLYSFLLYPIFSLPIIFFDSLLIVLKKAKQAVFFTIYLALIHFVSIIIPTYLGLGLSTTFFCISIGAALNFIVVLIYLLWEFKGVMFRWSLPILRNQLQYSIPLALSSIIGTLNRKIDFVMISFFFSVEVFAVYSAGAFEIPIVGVVMGVIISITVPEFVRLLRDDKKQELLRIWKSSITKVSLIFFPLFIFLFVNAKDFIEVLFTSKFQNSHLIFSILIFTLPLRIANYGSLLQSFGKTKLIFRYSIMTLVMNVILNYIFIKTFGFYGAAVSTVVSMYFMNILQLRAGGRLLGIRITEMMPFKNLGIVLLYSFVPFVLTLPVSSLLSEYAATVRITVIAVLYGTIYFALMVGLSPFKMDIREVVWSFVNRNKTSS